MLGAGTLTLGGGSTTIVNGQTTDIRNGGWKIGVIGDKLETVSGTTGFKSGGEFTGVAAKFKWTSPGDMEFKANQFNRTVNQANDVFLGPNTGTYIGAASSTMQKAALRPRAGISSVLL